MWSKINKGKTITRNKNTRIVNVIIIDLKNLKIELPKGWQESSRSSDKDRFWFWINHINPLSNINPKAFQDQLLPSSSDKIIITKMGLIGFGSRPLQDFYLGMKAFIAGGFAPPEINLEWLEKIWSGMTKTSGFERPGESDLSAGVSIVKYQTEEIARQSFKNMALMPTKGFDVPIPGGVQIPGISKDATITELLENDIYKEFMSGEQLEKMKERMEKYMPKEEFEKAKKQMDKFLSKEYMSKKRLEEMKFAIKEAQKEMPKVRQDLLKSGIKFREGKYLNHEAVYMEGKNPVPRPKSASSSKRVYSDTGMGSGGGYTALDPLPKFPQPYQKTIISYQAILVKEFIISGDLLWTITSLPSGVTPCYSLTQTKEKVHFVWEGGTKYKYIDIVPVVSNIAKEGYLYKEEVEEIIKKIIAKITI